MTSNLINLLASSGLQLHADGGIMAAGSHRSVAHTGWTVAGFHAESNDDVHADQWEMHPEGQEVVGVLAGRARLVLRADHTQREETVTLTAGTVYVVPRARWHRLVLEGPADLLSITMRHDTRWEPVA